MEDRFGPTSCHGLIREETARIKQCREKQSHDVDRVRWLIILYHLDHTLPEARAPQGSQLRDPITD